MASTAASDLLIEVWGETCRGRDLGPEAGRWLCQVILGKAWDAYRGLLGKSVQAGLARLALAQGPNRFDLVWSEPVLYQALLRWKTLGCFSESEIQFYPI